MTIESKGYGEFSFTLKLNPEQAAKAARYITKSGWIADADEHETWQAAKAGQFNGGWIADEYTSLVWNEGEAPTLTHSVWEYNELDGTAPYPTELSNDGLLKMAMEIREIIR